MYESLLLFKRGQLPKYILVMYYVSKYCTFQIQAYFSIQMSDVNLYITAPI